MTKEEQNKSTKEKILEVATKLFAKNGFSGTSVREIVTSADVNLAAINYHFKNKESLYWKVFEHNYYVIKNGVHQCGTTANTTADLAIEVYKFFISSESAIMNTFKMFLTDSVASPEGGFDYEEEHEPGPPGQEVFLEKIKNDLDGDFSPEALRWAVKMIFSLLVHFGVVMNTTIMKEKCKDDEDFYPENFEKFLRHSVKAHLDYLKSNPKLA